MTDTIDTDGVTYNFNDPQPELFSAIESADVARVQKELDRSTRDVNAVYHTMTPLGSVVYSDDSNMNRDAIISIMNLLLKYGADPYKSSGVCLVCSPIRPLYMFQFWMDYKLDIYRLFKDQSDHRNPDEVDRTFLDYCIDLGDMQRIQLLFDVYKPDPNFVHPVTGTSLLCFTMADPDYQIVVDEELVEKKIKFLIDRGANNKELSNKKGKTALDLAKFLEIKSRAIWKLLSPNTTPTQAKKRSSKGSGKTARTRKKSSKSNKGHSRCRRKART